MAPPHGTRLSSYDIRGALALSLLVKDANSQTQSLSTGSDGAGNLVPLHAIGATVAGVATPVTAAAPLPVVNAAGSAAIDGSSTINVGGTAQLLFAGVVPTNGFQIGNTSAGMIYVSDVGTAAAGGSSMPIAAGAIYTTPDGYRPAGAVSIYGASTGQSFAARRW
jgi:hypothetical protein